jgi:hypothetical protein
MDPEDRHPLPLPRERVQDEMSIITPLTYTQSPYSKQALAARACKAEYVQGARTIAADMLALTANALAIDGLRALESPKSSAAFHEAGHA